MREMQIKVKVRYHFLSITLANMKQTAFISTRYLNKMFVLTYSVMKVNHYTIFGYQFDNIYYNVRIVP